MPKSKDRLPSIVDRTVNYWADRFAFARSEWLRITKSHESTLPLYL